MSFQIAHVALGVLCYSIVSYGAFEPCHYYQGGILSSNALQECEVIYSVYRQAHIPSRNSPHTPWICRYFCRSLFLRPFRANFLGLREGGRVEGPTKPSMRARGGGCYRSGHQYVVPFSVHARALTLVSISLADVIIDTILVLAPVKLIWRVDLSKSRKIMLIAVFSSSAVTTTVSLVHAVAIYRVGGAVEVLCAIVEVCFPHAISLPSF